MYNMCQKRVERAIEMDQTTPQTFQKRSYAVEMTEYSGGFPRFILGKLTKSSFSFVRKVNMHAGPVKFIPMNFSLQGT